MNKWASGHPAAKARRMRVACSRTRTGGFQEAQPDGGELGLGEIA